MTLSNPLSWSSLLDVPIPGLYGPKPELSIFPVHACMAPTSVSGTSIYPKTVTLTQKQSSLTPSSPFLAHPLPKLANLMSVTLTSLSTPT